jgi:hypothetical protein
LGYFTAALNYFIELLFFCAAMGRSLIIPAAGKDCGHSGLAADSGWI